MTERPLWTPSPARIAASKLTSFTSSVRRSEQSRFTSYRDLHEWSIRHPDRFWRSVWSECGVIGEPGATAVVDLNRMPGARFFPDSRLNFAENLLKGDPAAPAIFAHTESRAPMTLTRGELASAVARAARALQAEGVQPRDRVCGVVANVPEAIIAALATSSIGATWASCSPDFGADGIVDRFGQIDPKVLVTVDAYVYGGKRFECANKVADAARRMPGLVRTVVVPLAGGLSPADFGPCARSWNDWLEPHSPTPFARFEWFAFDHPLYVLFSSGTTGAPKCIVHGAGGTLLQHLKEHQLHYDVRRHDRVFYFTTCGWMMWNWLVSALASEAALVLYDGAPLYPRARLFDLADEIGVTLFGVSARFIESARQEALDPVRTHSLNSVRTVTSTGSPLSPESFDFVYEHVKADVHLASLSGGTDIVSCFVGGNPNAPVWRGEIQAPGLGMDVQVYDDEGRRVVGTAGELVCATPFPSMPIGFWNDPDGQKYHDAYFAHVPGVWHHGDWIKETDHGGYVIYGRSDATLKPSGVRIGTAEIYRQLEGMPEIVESLAVGQRWQGDERIVLFVRLEVGRTLTDELRRRIVDRLRTHASPRHVPARIVQVTDIPRTRSGKLVELAVKRMIHGEAVPNRDALANPDALELFRNLEDIQS